MEGANIDIQDNDAVSETIILERAYKSHAVKFIEQTSSIYSTQLVQLGTVMLSHSKKGYACNLCIHNQSHRVLGIGQLE